MIKKLKEKNVQWALVFFVLSFIVSSMSFNTSSDILNMLGNIVLNTLSIVLIVVAIREIRNIGEWENVTRINWWVISNVKNWLTI